MTGLKSDMQYLDLSHNELGNMGVRLLTRSSWHNIKELYLSNEALTKGTAMSEGRA